MELDRLRQTIQDMRKKHADSQTKSSSQITTLQQQNHNLRVQAHFNVFRARVQFVVKQKQVEQVKKANSALMEQNRRLGEQVHDMDRRAAEQNVSFDPMPLVLGCLLTSTGSGRSLLSSWGMSLAGFAL